MAQNALRYNSAVLYSSSFYVSFSFEGVSKHNDKYRICIYVNINCAYKGVQICAYNILLIVQLLHGNVKKILCKSIFAGAIAVQVLEYRRMFPFRLFCFP